MSSPPRLAIIILNWRQPEVTLRCFDSVINIEYNNIDIYVCDNDSGDGSMEKIVQDLSARLDQINEVRTGKSLHPFELRTVKPVIENHGNLSSGVFDNYIRRITVIDTGKNGGYAYGNNVGVKLALQTYGTEYFWILNNDTTVDRSAASWMIEKMLADRAIGICGSMVLYMNQTDKIQTMGGGRFLPWKARCEQLGEGALLSEISSLGDLASSLDYINGASAMVTRRFIETIGLMDESYFLYYEELDWAVRGRAAGFKLSYSPKSIIYHQVGVSSGTADDGTSSASSVFYAERSKFKFLVRHFPQFLPVAIPLLVREYVRRILQRRRRSANAMLRGAFRAFFN